MSYSSVSKADITQVPFIVKAKLVHSIDYMKTGKRKVAPADTVIDVDVNQMIGSYKGDHFDVSLDEIDVLNKN